MKALRLKEVTLHYGGRPVIERLGWEADAGKVYSIVGPNGCGKSTLLKAIARQLKPRGGAILLEDSALERLPPRQLARRLAMLQQSQERLPDMTVRALVGYGRFPHKPAWGPLRREDEDIVDWALARTGTRVFADRKLSALSGGERQRVRLALALAQQPRVLLLDEPTTYLDVSHQLEMLELVADINRTNGMTIVMVLHDLNHAAAYSDEIAVMRGGALYACGTPEETLTGRMLDDVFGVKARIERDPDTGRPVCLITGLSDARRGEERRDEETTAADLARFAKAEEEERRETYAR